MQSNADRTKCDLVYRLTQGRSPNQSPEWVGLTPEFELPTLMQSPKPSIVVVTCNSKIFGFKDP